MIGQNRVAGVVVLYNSSHEIIHNIKTYIDQVEVLYVVDNSFHVDNVLIEKICEQSKVKYHSFGDNIGIASALNWAAETAIGDGFEFLLTMDDDTKIPANMICIMLNFWRDYTYPIGLISGIHHNKKIKKTYRKLLYTLTSGNLLNLDAYEIIGGFNSELFIDHVDHDYCIRLNEAGYHVIELPDFKLDHRLGTRKSIKIMNKVIMYYGTHSPLRFYYYVRNGVFLTRNNILQHPIFFLELLKELTKRFIKILILDEDKIYRLRMLLEGIKDGWNGRLGRY